MDPHSVYEIISGPNTITAALPLWQNTVKLITLISSKYRWKDLLKQKHGAVVSTDAFSMLCEVSPLNMIKKHFPHAFPPLHYLWKHLIFLQLRFASSTLSFSSFLLL